MSFRSYAPIDGRGREIAEQCDRCGKRQINIRGGVVFVHHKCANPVPGPGSPPGPGYKLDTVEIIPGDFTVEQLRQQRDELEAALGAMRPEYHRLRRTVQAIQEALERTR